MKTPVRKLIATVCFFLCFCAIYKGLHYLLVNDVNSYTRLMMHQLYHTEKNIDVLFAGNSHVYLGVDPEVADVSFGAYTFNAASSSQFMDGTLAVIKEALRENDIKEIYVDVFYGVMSDEDYSERENMFPTYYLSDFMKPSLNKADFLLHASSKKHYTNSFFILHRYWETLLDIQSLLALHTSKSTDNYRQYGPVSMQVLAEYKDRGFVTDKKVLEEEKIINPFAQEPIELDAMLHASDYRNSLDEIVALCKSRQIELVLFVTPVPEWTIIGKGNYDTYSETFRSYAQENGIAFYDFNYCRNEYFDTNDRMMFRDYDHLNHAGALHFSFLFGDLVRGRVSEEAVFYSSLTEKMRDHEPRVYGLAGPEHTGDTDVSRVVSNRPGELAYRFSIIPEGADTETLLQDYSENDVFSVPHEQRGQLRIDWRSTADPQITGTLTGVYQYIEP
ncbi:MAG: hypothetical protein IJQ21_12570 [Lachnospiraceae bacterium]|nr:hypothetical protein [Lachnospiraceae bacterium]